MTPAGAFDVAYVFGGLFALIVLTSALPAVGLAVAAVLGLWSGYRTVRPL